MSKLGVAQAAQVAQLARQRSLAQVTQVEQVAMMVMPQWLGSVQNALVMQLWLDVIQSPGLHGFGQELLEHFLPVNEAVIDPV